MTRQFEIASLIEVRISTDLSGKARQITLMIHRVTIKYLQVKKKLLVPENTIVSFKNRPLIGTR